MEWIGALQGKVVGLDTTPIIYFIEENPTYLDMVHPFRRGDNRLAQQYRAILLDAENLTTIFLSQDIAEEAARLRAVHNIRTPDAIQMATVLHPQKLDQFPR